MSATIKNEVLIIGAGFAGAACALRLAENGIRSTIIEAQQRIGGRAQTVKLAENVLIDMGASNVHGYQHGSRNPARALCEKLGIDLKVPNPGDGMVFGRDKKPISNERRNELQQAIAKIMARREAEEGGQKDGSLGSQVVQELSRVGDEAEPLARTAELGAGIRLEEISARYWQSERGFAGVDALPVGGYSAVVSKAIEKSGADLRLGEEVIKVEQDQDAVSVTTQLGHSYAAPYVISTIPVAVLQTGKVAFNPSLPSERSSLISRTSVGLLDKFALLYEEVWWPAASSSFVFLPTTSFSDLPPKGSARPGDILEAATVMTANMHALSDAKPPVLLLYLPPHAAERLERFSDEKLTEAAHSYIASRLQSVASADIHNPASGHMVRWRADPYALGATTSPIALGKDAKPEDLDELGKPLWDGRLGFAGEGTDRNLRGSVPGAVASGEREAERLVRLLRP